MTYTSTCLKPTPKAQYWNHTEEILSYKGRLKKLKKDEHLAGTPNKPQIFPGFHSKTALHLPQPLVTTLPKLDKYKVEFRILFIERTEEAPAGDVSSFKLQ